MSAELFTVVYIQRCDCHLIMKRYGRYICRMGGIFSSSSKLCIYIPKFYRRFNNYILYVARSYFSGCLVFYVQEVSVILISDKSIA